MDVDNIDWIPTINMGYSEENETFVAYENISSTSDISTSFAVEEACDIDMEENDRSAHFNHEIDIEENDQSAHFNDQIAIEENNQSANFNNEIDIEVFKTEID